MIKVGDSKHGNMIIFNKQKFSILEFSGQRFKNTVEGNYYTQNFLYAKVRQNFGEKKEINLITTHLKSKVNLM
jgi:hypothetical protein